MRAATVLVIVLWSTLLLGWLTLHWGILPHINDWRGRIEQQATVALGLPVHIGHIEVRSSGWVPMFELQDVTLHDAQGRVALRLPQVSAALAPQSLLTLQLQFAQLHLRDLQLVVRRDRGGRLHVAGMGLPEQQAAVEGSAAADWFLSQHEFVVENGQVQWIDEAAGMPPLLLQQVQLALRNGARRHDWRLSATPPEALGQRLSLTGRFTQPLLARAGDWQRWSGTLYAELPAAQLPALREQLGLPLDLRDGRASLRAWLDLADGHWQRAVVDSAWADLALGWPGQATPLRLAQASGRITAEQARGRLSLAVQDLGLRGPDGLRWPATQGRLVWQPAPGGTGWAWPTAGQVREGEFRLAPFDLAELGQLLAQWPLPAALHEHWAALAPQGQVQGLQAQWSGPTDRPTRYRLRGQVRGMAVAPGTPAAPDTLARPGWRNVNLSLDANEGGGQAVLALQQGALWLPGVFAEAELPLAQFNGKLTWALRQPAGGNADAPPDIAVHLLDGRFANADAQGDLTLHWHTGGMAGPADARNPEARFPGVLDLSGQLRGGRASAVARYLPLGLGDSVRQYVAAAVREGQIPQANFKVQGPLQDFPFAQRRSGEFRVAAQIRHGVLAYVPGTEAGADGGDPPWPPFSEVQGELVFHRGAMEIHNAQARLWGIALQQVNGAIRDLVHQPTLSLQGQGRGPLNDALRFVGATPVGRWTHHALGRATGSGEAELRLRLDIPLDDLEHTRVDGRVGLNGNDVHLRPDLPVLAAARAQVHFSHQGFRIDDGSARILGGEASVVGGSLPDGSVRIRAQGSISAEGLRQAAELGPAARLAGLLSGQTPYQLDLGFARDQVEYSLRSPLTGLALDLPAPLHKTAAERWPLLVQASLVDDGTASATRDTLKLELGPLLQAQWQRDLSGPNPRVLRGTLGLGQVMPALPTSGVVGAANLGVVVADAWASAGRKAASLMATASSLSAPSAPDQPTAAWDTGYLPAELQFQAQALSLQGHALTHLQGRLQRRSAAAGADTVHLQLQSDQAQGEADWQPAANAQTPARLVAHLSRLALPLAPTTPTVPPASAAAPAQEDAAPASGHPTLDIRVDELSWRQQVLGRLELAASGTPREWRVAKLSLANADAALSGSGRWAAAPSPRMNLDLQLQLRDGGALLARAGLGQVLRDGAGQIKAQLQWPGSPLAPSLATITGQAQVALERGQILQVEPGAARLLGVLSLQSLPRRLSLDFRDVFQQGFGFDAITGDLRLEAGVARSTNLRVRGVQAAVLMEGQSDLLHETQDLHVVVVPDINAGTASLAYAAINPAVGLGTFLAQFLLRDTMKQAGTREFHITGTWDQPITEGGERPAPAADAAASAAGNNPL